MAEGIIGRMANRLKQIFEPEDPLAGFQRRGRPYTAMTDEELANVSFPALDELRARAQNPERFQMTPRQFLEPYYGSNLDREIEAARAAQRRQDLGGAFSSVYRNIYTQDYDKIDQPVNIEIQQDPKIQYGPDYSPSKNLARLNNPNFKGWMDLVNKRLSSPDPEKQKKTQELLEKASIAPEEVIFALKNPINEMAQVAEHEMGHAFSKGAKSGGRGHMAKGSEMSNAMGKIQRDTYSIFGKRFDGDSLQAFIEKEMELKPEERFKDYSRESKRGFRKIIEFYENEGEPWQWVRDNIGKFVQSPKPKTQPTV